MTETYQCFRCGKVFVSPRSDAEAWAEFKSTGGIERKEDCAVVCADCYNAFVKFHQESARGQQRH